MSLMCVPESPTVSICWVDDKKSLPEPMMTQSAEVDVPSGPCAVNSDFVPICLM